jgi:CheY-like chemotaxis protein
MTQLPSQMVPMNCPLPRRNPDLSAIRIARALHRPGLLKPGLVKFGLVKFGLVKSAVILIVATVTSPADAQDPFEELGNQPARAATNADQSADLGIDSNETSAVVRSLRANPPTTPSELAQAVGLMTRIRRWDEAARWLDRIGRLELDGPTALAVLRGAGPRTWAAIEANAGAFKTEQLQLIDKLRKLADDEVHSPANLAAQVNRLTSPNQADRLAGFDALRAAGDSGITALLDAVMRTNGLNPNPSMIEAFSLLGPNATAAWHTAMTSPHHEVRDRLIQLVHRAPKPSMGPELLTAIHDPTLSESTKTGIRRSLAERGKSAPEPQQAFEYNIATLDKSLDQFRRLSALNDVDARNVWTLNQDGHGISTRPGNAADQSLVRASQAALQALRTAPAGDAVSARALATYLEELSRNGATELADSPVFQSLLPESLRESHEFGCLIWDAATEERLPGAQALAVRNLARWQGALMPNPVRDRLAKASKSGHPSVRYPATIALMNSLLDQKGLIPSAQDHDELSTATTAKISQATATQRFTDRSAASGNTTPAGNTTLPSDTYSGFEQRGFEPRGLEQRGYIEGGFQGASRVDINAREMQQLMADPMVMIIGASPSLRSHSHGLLSAMGLRYWEASSVDDVFNGLRNSVPIEGILIVDHLRDLDLGQLIQRIRSNPSTSTVPIALLAENLSSGEHLVAAADHGVVVGSVPPSIEGLGDILSRMNQMLAYPRATPEDRIFWKDNAVNYLRAAYPQNPSLLNSGASIRLADTQEEQNNLLRIVADASQTPRQREQASQIFVQSIRRFGLLISSDTLNGQYDAYNSRGETEPVTRLVMGQILDAIDEVYGRTASDPLP